jgi:intracellular septation protein A
MKNLIYAARPLLNDFLSTIFFVVLIAAGVEVRIATACAIGFGVVHLAVLKALRRPVAALQWASLGLVLVFGAASLLTQDPRYLMAKPTLVYLAIAAVMLKRGWMLRYMPPIARAHGEALMVAFGYVWAGLMALTAVANLVVAVWFTRDWPLFMAVVPTASKIALFAVQYLTVRQVVRRRIMAERQGALQPA